MKNLFFLVFILCTCLFSVSNTWAGEVFGPEPTATDPMVSGAFLQDDISLHSFYQYSPKTHKEITGERMGIKDRAFLLFVKADLKQRHRKGESFSEGIGLDNEAKKFHLGGFLLGFLFGLIGLLLSLLWKNKNVRRSAFKGLVAWLVILLVLTLAGNL